MQPSRQVRKELANVARGIYEYTRYNVPPDKDEREAVRQRHFMENTHDRI